MWSSGLYIFGPFVQEIIYYFVNYTKHIDDLKAK